MAIIKKITARWEFTPYTTKRFKIVTGDVIINVVDKLYDVLTINNMADLTIFEMENKDVGQFFLEL